MSDLENARPGHARSSPAGNEAVQNSAPTAQASIVGDRYGWIVSLVFAVLALILAALMFLSLRGISSDVENIRGLIQNSADAATQAAVEAAVAAERADKAERSAAINREYAVQVFPQLNRMGFPVRTPGEVDHYVAQPEDYARLEAFRAQQEHKP